jgi:hypothetical protein
LWPIFSQSGTWKAESKFPASASSCAAMIEGSRDMYVMVISKKAGSVLTRDDLPFQ